MHVLESMSYGQKGFRKCRFAVGILPQAMERLGSFAFYN